MALDIQKYVGGVIGANSTRSNRAGAKSFASSSLWLSEYLSSVPTR